MASFDENGKYIKTNWKAGDKITATKLNKIEESIEAVNDNDISRHVEADARLDALEAKDAAHDKEFTNVKNTIADNKAAAELGDYEINSRMTFLENELNEGIEEVHNVAETVDGKIAQAEADMGAQVNQGKADMEAMVAEVEADLEGLHAKDEELSEQLADIAINITSLGVVMNSDIPQTDKLQNAIDYCIENNKELFIPSGYIVVDDTIYIKNSIRMHGHNSSTYSKTSSNIRVIDSNKDINVFYIEKEDGETVPAFHLENIYISRKRSSIIDNYNDDNIFAYGMLSTAIYAHMDEGSLKNITIVGFKNGVVFKKSQILELNTSDILMCETGIRLLNSFGAINIENNNFCYNKTTVEFDCKGYLFNFNNNHAESALNHFIITNSALNKLEQINILNNNFTQHEDNTESFLKIFIKGSGYSYSRNIYIENNHLIMKNGNPINIEYENIISDVDIYMNNNTILCDNPISNENKSRIYWNSSYFLSNGSKWSDRSYLTDSIRGIELNNNNIFLNSPLTLKGYDYTNYPTNVKGRMFFDDTRGTISFYNEKQTRLNIPLYMLNTTTAIPTTTDIEGGTISQNVNGDKGSPLGWVFDANTQTWNPFGQIGHRSANINPVSGGLRPRYIGEEYLDLSSNTWYKSVGLTVSDWVKISV